ncbi:MAG: response regulator, partial [Minicystis sp.]
MVSVDRPATTRAMVWIVNDLRSEVASLIRSLSPDFDLESFEDGPQMLERLQHTPPPDALVLEQWLRGASGVDLCRALRERPATVGLPILLLTVPVDNEEIIEGLAAGADDHLIKPFNVAVLMARIGALVRMKRLRDRAEQEEQAARRERDRFQSLSRLLALGSDVGIALVTPWPASGVTLAKRCWVAPSSICSSTPAPRASSSCSPWCGALARPSSDGRCRSRSPGSAA